MSPNDKDKPATRADLQTAESRLDKKIDKVAVELMRTQGQIEAAEERLNTKMDEGFDRVVKTVDSFVARIETYARESVTIPKTLDAHGDKLREHEKRLDSLEAKA